MDAPGRMVRGAVAGAVGTLAMDLVWYRRARAGGSDERFVDWEFATSTASFDDAAAPGRVAARLAGLAGVDLPDEAAGLATNVVHWATGIGYGVGHGLVQHRRGAVVGGVGTGLAAVASSYATLGALGVYEPVWRYDRETLQADVTAHLAYGLAVATAYRWLTRRAR